MVDENWRNERGKDPYLSLLSFSFPRWVIQIYPTSSVHLGTSTSPPARPLARGDPLASRLCAQIAQAAANSAAATAAAAAAN